MQFTQDNDFTDNRESKWYESWPIVCLPPNDASGYRDVSASDYLPQGLLRFRFETLLAYPADSTVYRNYLHASTIVVVIYLVLTFVGQRLMRSRKPFGLKRSLACWNLLLAVYSTMGALRLLPHIAYTHWINPPAYLVCRNAQGHSGEAPVYFWISLFIWSKYVELVDTLFLVLRKKPVSFLHWFHHTTVLLYTWHSMAHQTNTGIYFAGINYFVHSIMYFYYFLAAIGKPPNWGLFVTVIQIAQMFIGIGINAFQFYSAYLYPHCDVAWRNIYAAIVMYTVYMALFVQFFLVRYCRSGAKVHYQPMKNGTANDHNGHTEHQQTGRSYHDHQNDAVVDKRKSD